MLEAFCLEYYGSAPSIPPQLVVPPAAGDTTALEEFLSDRRGSRVEVRAPGSGARRGGSRSSPTRTRSSRSSPTCIQSEQKRLRRVEALEELRECAEPREPPDPDRVLRHLEHPGRVAGRVDGRLPGRGAEEGALPEVRRARPRSGPDDFAAIAEVVSRRFARLGDVTARGVRRVVRGAFRTWSSSTAARASSRRRSRRCSRTTCRASPSSRWRSGRRRSSSRAAPTRSCSPRDSAGPPAPAADPRRGAPLRARLPPPAPRDAGARLDLRRPRRGSARSAAARCCGTSARPSGCSRRPRRSSKGVPGVPAKTARAIYAQLHKAGRAHEEHVTREPGQVRWRSYAVFLPVSRLAGCGGARARSRRPRPRRRPLRTTTTSGDPGKDAIEAFVAAARAGQHRRDVGDCSRREHEERLGPTLARVRERCRRTSSPTSVGGFAALQGDRLGAAHARVRRRRDRRRRREAAVYAAPLRLEGERWKVELGGPVVVRPIGPDPGCARARGRADRGRGRGPGRGRRRRHVPRRARPSSPQVRGTASNSTLFANFDAGARSRDGTRSSSSRTTAARRRRPPGRSPPRRSDPPPTAGRPRLQQGRS